MLLEMAVFEVEVVTKFMKHPVDRRKYPRADLLTSTVIALVLRVSTNQNLCLALCLSLPVVFRTGWAGSAGHNAACFTL